MDTEGPRHGSLRDWEGDLFTAHVVLLVIPGMGMLGLAAVWSLLVGDSTWILLILFLASLGVVMRIWGGLLLPIPRWFPPRDVKARAKARNA